MDWRGDRSGNRFRLTDATVGLVVYRAILSSKISEELAAEIIPAVNAAGLPLSSERVALAAAYINVYK